MRVQMFDVLSNEKSRKSRRGFDLLTFDSLLTYLCQQNMLLKYVPPKNKHEMEVPMLVNRQTKLDKNNEKKTV